MTMTSFQVNIHSNISPTPELYSPDLPVRVNVQLSLSSMQASMSGSITAARPRQKMTTMAFLAVHTNHTT